MENSMKGPQKNNYHMIQQFHSWIYSIYLKKMKTNSKRYMHPNVHSSTIYSSQDMEATQVPNQQTNG